MKAPWVKRLKAFSSIGFRRHMLADDVLEDVIEENKLIEALGAEGHGGSKDPHQGEV